MMDPKQPNTLESSMCKAEAGDVGRRGRDAKMNDLFEGTGQINRLVIARRILGYTSRELK